MTISLYLYGYNDTSMISIEHALEAVDLHTKEITLGATIPLRSSGNATLFDDVFSPINMPPFRQSAMDGYALNLHDKATYSVVGEVKAGDSHQTSIQPGESIRIFTGAPVPESANAVVMQEKAQCHGATITIDGPVKEHQNIRPLGEQVKKGGLALKKGTKLTPAAIGYLSSLGIIHVQVYKKPSIALISTGNELVQPGQPLTFGKIYESNSVMLQQALLHLGFHNVSIHKIADNYNDTYNTLQQIILNNELVIITGGISVGDFDFVGKALKELEVKEIFYKVNQKPGKPLFFGKKDTAVLFALPGNPAAALTCFYIYVLRALKIMAGLPTEGLLKVRAISNSNFIKNGERPQFLKAVYKNGKVTILEGQSSAMLQTFALANALVKISGEVAQIKANDMVDVMLFPI